MSTNVNFEKFGIMLDCSRNAVMNVKALKKWIDIISDLGYNTLMLYTEDTYEVENQPFFGYRRGRYSKEELKEIDAYSAQKGIELVPCIQTLAHLNAIFRWDVYREILDCDDIMLAENEKTYKLVDDMFTTLEKTFTSRTVNIGMDEAHMLGRGKYQDIHGHKNGSDILLTHLCKVADIAKNHGFEIIMWGDMFFRLMSGGEYYADTVQIADKVKAMVPDNVNLVYWDYYSLDQQHYEKQIKAHSSIKDNIWFAGGLWSWTGFAPHNAYSMAATKAALDACSENGVKNVFLTMWGDNGAECSKFALLPSLYYASELAKGNTDMESIKNGFKAKYGISFDDFMLADLTGTPNDNDKKIYNPEKYMLYNDLFLGLFDSSVIGDEGKMYAECAAKLDAISDNSEYGYVFKNLSALCKTLEIKWDLGIRTRKAYKEQDKETLKALLADYKELVERLEAFYKEFREQWMIENKPYGFEVQDIRVGGLIQRTKNCYDCLVSYIDGRIDSIPELEEEVLPYNGNENKDYYSYNVWEGNVSASVI